MQEELIYNGRQQTGDKRCRRDTCLYARNTGGLEKEGRGGPIDVTKNKQRTKGGRGGLRSMRRIDQVSHPSFGEDARRGWVLSWFPRLRRSYFSSMSRTPEAV